MINNSQPRMDSDQLIAFKRSESFFKATLNALSAHIAILDSAGSIVAVNTAWRKFGQENGLELSHHGLGTNYLDVCERAQGEDREEAAVAATGIRNVLAKRCEYFYLEYPCHSPDDQRWFILRATPFKTDNQIWAVVAHENITKRKQAEKRIAEQQAQLTHAVRLNMLGEMASGIAHEINQPLTAIYSYAKACIKKIHVGASDPEMLIESLEKISEAAHRGGEVIRGLRAMVKRRTDKPEAIQLGSLMRDVVKLAKLDSRSQKFRFKFEVPFHLPHALADSLQIQHVLLNLIRNAIDAMEEVPETDKVITLSANLLHNDFIEVAVEDRGSGLSESAAKQLFDPFFTTKEAGIGMDLTIAQSIVLAQGGHLWFTVNREQGITFHFTLPAAR